MSMVICPKCNTKVSDAEGRCFICGASLRGSAPASDARRTGTQTGGASAAATGNRAASGAGRTASSAPGTGRTTPAAAGRPAGTAAGSASGRGAGAQTASGRGTGAQTASGRGTGSAGSRTTGASQGRSSATGINRTPSAYTGRTSQGSVKRSGTPYSTSSVTPVNRSLSTVRTPAGTAGSTSTALMVPSGRPRTTNWPTTTGASPKINRMAESWPSSMENAQSNTNPFAAGTNGKAGYQNNQAGSFKYSQAVQDMQASEQPVMQPQPVRQPQPVMQPEPVQPVMQPQPVRPVMQPQPVQPVMQPQPIQPDQTMASQPGQFGQPVMQPQPIQPDQSMAPQMGQFGQPVMEPQQVQPDQTMAWQQTDQFGQPVMQPQSSQPDQTMASQPGQYGQPAAQPQPGVMDQAFSQGQYQPGMQSFDEQMPDEVDTVPTVSSIIQGNSANTASQPVVEPVIIPEVMSDLGQTTPVEPVHVNVETPGSTAGSGVSELEFIQVDPDDIEDSIPKPVIDNRPLLIQLTKKIRGMGIFLIIFAGIICSGIMFINEFLYDYYVIAGAGIAGLTLIACILFVIISNKKLKQPEPGYDTVGSQNTGREQVVDSPLYEAPAENAKQKKTRAKKEKKYKPPKPPKTPKKPDQKPTRRL